jgi:hypothetical protein
MKWVLNVEVMTVCVHTLHHCNKSVERLKRKRATKDARHCSYEMAYKVIRAVAPAYTARSMFSVDTQIANRLYIEANAAVGRTGHGWKIIRIWNQRLRRDACTLLMTVCPFNTLSVHPHAWLHVLHFLDTASRLTDRLVCRLLSVTNCLLI